VLKRTIVMELMGIKMAANKGVSCPEMAMLKPKIL
jgi:hypothetical protein